MIMKSLFSVIILCFINIVTSYILDGKFPLLKRISFIPLKASFLSNIFKGKEPKKLLSKEDSMLAFLEEKSWRAPKIRNLPIRYRPWKESWRERFRTQADDTITIYTYPENSLEPQTRLSLYYQFPWLWHRHKANRVSYLFKHFQEDLENFTIQEHIEMDSFLSEHDMPERWGLTRMFDVDAVFLLCLNIVGFGEFSWHPPTDLGIRSDNTVRTCSVLSRNCVSSSNDPGDVDHYVKPLRWSRSKSPEQAFEEMKYIYFNYPPRGISYFKGWIDLGGWRPQTFSGTYFHTSGKSGIYRFYDDIEVIMDYSKREVGYRSSARLGNYDCEVQKIRYNEYVRLLEKFGGWDNQYEERTNYIFSLPYRTTQYLLDRGYETVERLADDVLLAVGYGSTDSSEGGSGVGGRAQDIGAARRLAEEVAGRVQSYAAPLREYWEQIQSNEQVQTLEKSMENILEETGKKIEDLGVIKLDDLEEKTEKVLQWVPSQIDKLSKYNLLNNFKDIYKPLGIIAPLPVDTGNTGDNADNTKYNQQIQQQQQLQEEKDKNSVINNGDSSTTTATSSNNMEITGSSSSGGSSTGSASSDSAISKTVTSNEKKLKSAISLQEKINAAKLKQSSSTGVEEGTTGDVEWMMKDIDNKSIFSKIYDFSKKITTSTKVKGRGDGNEPLEYGYSSATTISSEAEKERFREQVETARLKFLKSF